MSAALPETVRPPADTFRVWVPPPDGGASSLDELGELLEDVREELLLCEGRSSWSGSSSHSSDEGVWLREEAGVLLEEGTGLLLDGLEGGRLLDGAELLLTKGWEEEEGVEEDEEAAWEDAGSSSTEEGGTSSDEGGGAVSMTPMPLMRGGDTSPGRGTPWTPPGTASSGAHPASTASSSARTSRMTERSLVIAFLP